VKFRIFTLFSPGKPGPNTASKNQ